MFAIKRLRSGEILFNFDWQPFPLFLKFIVNLDKLFSKKIFYLGIMGLGIGFGLSLVVFSQPYQIKAGSSYQHTTIKPQTLIIPTSQLNLKVTHQNYFSLTTNAWSSQTVYFDNWLNYSDIFIIGSTSLKSSKLDLGDELQIVAKNQGLYKFHVYHLREILSKDINQLKSETEAKLIIILPENWLGLKNQVVLAK